MELCKKVQSEEYVIHVVGSTNFYTRLRFSLLASTWFPRPVGVCLWSALHMFLVLFKALMLLVLFPSVFAIAVLVDTFMGYPWIYMLLAFPLVVILYFLGIGIVIAVVWLWLLITCKCCTMRGRAPGQGLGHYIRTAGGILQSTESQLRHVVATARADADGELWGLLSVRHNDSLTVTFVDHVIRVSFPYCREKLGDWCREIVPWNDTVVI